MIGITGGVGAGKTEVLKIIEESCNCRIIHSDDVGNRVKEPQGECYEEIVSLLGNGILKEDGTIDRGKMAEKIFSDQELLSKVNGIIHPAVKRYILKELEKERENGTFTYFFIEAALLIEDGYDKICDELWYIHTEDEVRKARLKASRGYSDEKTEQIMKNQRCREEFEKYCRITIDNSKDRENTRAQIKKALASCRKLS